MIQRLWFSAALVVCVGATNAAAQEAATGRFTTAGEVRPILEATKANWVAVRDFNGQDLVYVTHLWAWRCGLTGIEIGVNGAPREPWPLPDCHMDQANPNAVRDEDGLPYQAFPQNTVQILEGWITYDDGQQSSLVAHRASVTIP